ncbi:MAG: rhodanese-like domain-containing protein [Pseudomonadota bacterium]|nr:rhodanese-like domain-containing protein [Pseudomonadota bacterium]
MKTIYVNLKMSESLALIIFLSICLLPVSARAEENPKLWSAEKLQARLAEPNLVVVDTRNALSYRKSHIKGAIHLDTGCSGPLVHQVGEVPCSLRQPDELIAELKKNGICPDRNIVVYGDHNSWGAEGRLFWILEKLGFTKLALLDGGYDRWRHQSGSTGALFANHKEPCPASAMNHLSAAGLKQANLNASTLWPLYQKGNLIFLDVRTKAEFDGVILYREQRGGHLPEALHLDWETLWNDDYTLKSRAELLTLLTEIGLPQPEQSEKKLIVPYCTGGIRSGFAWFVLRRLGYPAVENYDNGFWEWASTPELPVHQR